MMPPATSNPRRKSVFREVGLVDDDREKYAPVPSVPILSLPTSLPRKPRLTVRFPSDVARLEEVMEEDPARDDFSDDDDCEKGDNDDDSLNDLNSRKPDVPCKAPDVVQLPPAAITSGFTRLHRLCVLALLVFLIIPITHNLPLFGTPGKTLGGAYAALIPRHLDLEKREDSPTDVCTRWSHATALVNGTLYIYGGRAKTETDQSSNTWNNDFLTLDLTKSWQISSPSFTGLPKPSGPPAVSLAYLWNSRTSLYLYGGEFQDGNDGNTADPPTAFSLWEYDIGSSSWTEHDSPKMSAGTNAASGNAAVQRAAEGAGANVPQIGRGFYFGGHLDTWTTEDWSYLIDRVYLRSLVEYTFPDYSNDGVDSLTDGKTASDDGVWRNVTEGGLQETSGFPERADGILVYVPGFGDEGILLGLAGGTNSTLTQMNVIDIYDIATSTWFKQPTSGTPPKIRVNPCAVVAAAADGSSYNMYMFGGQDLDDTQTQYNDMWILSVPSFTWIEVESDSSQSVPYARAGHTCNIWDGQLIVVGGYVGDDISCDSPGVYVFNTSSLSWGTQFTALSGTDAQDSSGGVFAESSNPFSQQLAQRGSNSTSGLEGSYGYTVPDEVVSAIGGGPTGGATVTAPVQTVSEGPLATGQIITYTVTGADGTVTTQTGSAGSGYNNRDSGPNVGAIVGGVLAGVFFVIAAYLAFCAYIYRRQLQLYKNHVAMAQAHAADPARAHEKTGFVMPPGGAAGGVLGSSMHTSTDDRQSTNPRNNSHAATGGGSSGYAAGSSGGAGQSSGGGTDGRRSGSVSSMDDLLAGNEPSFWGTRGVLLNPRRSLRVINRD